ncbi:MAG: toxin-antitoxin system YwqK family antitoxin [Bacteroidales bacterium]|nr:toxin-antitoxin system YwqK family antitoxin [Bacteroidales bacterium]
MKYHLLILFTVLFSYGSFAGQTRQDTIFNQTGSKGLKQGYWKKFYPNGNLMYEGCFKDDKPTGEMKRYFESGNLKAILIFDENTGYAKASIYYEDGALASEGYYLNSEKDSVWSYYSYYDHKLKSRETYKKGIKHGFSYEYYPEGGCFEKTQWKNNLKDGIWEQYYEDGSVRLRAAYIQGKLSGSFTAYYLNKHPMVAGHYKDNKQEGTWIYYSEDGDVSQEIAYSSGQPMNENELTRQQQEFFRMIEMNIGKFREPVPSDFFPRNKYSGNEY